MFARRALKAIIVKLRRTSGYELDNVYIELVDSLKDARQRKIAHDLGLLATLEAHIASGSISRRILILRILLRFENENEYHYEIAVKHRFVVFGLEVGLNEAIGDVRRWVPDGTRSASKQQLALDLVACWLHLLLYLTKHASVIRALCGDADDDVVSADFFSALLNASQLCSEHPSLHALLQHRALYWQIVARLMQNDLIAKQFGDYSDHWQLLHSEFRCKLPKSLEEHLYMFKVVDVLAETGAVSRALRSDANGEFGVAVVNELHLALVEICRGERVWSDEPICSDGSHGMTSTMRHAACGMLLAAWCTMLRKAEHDSELLRAIFSQLAWLDITFELIVSVADRSGDFALLRMAIGAAAMSISLGMELGIPSAVTSSAGVDVVIALIRDYWTPCPEAQCDLCCLMEAVPIAADEAVDIFSVLMPTLENASDRFEVIERILLLCSSISRNYPERLLRVFVKAMVTRLSQLPVGRRENFVFVHAFFACLAQVASEIWDGILSHLDFDDILCIKFEETVEFLAFCLSSPGRARSGDLESCATMLDLQVNDIVVGLNADSIQDATTEGNIDFGVGKDSIRESLPNRSQSGDLEIGSIVQAPRAHETEVEIDADSIQERAPNSTQSGDMEIDSIMLASRVNDVAVSLDAYSNKEASADATRSGDVKIDTIMQSRQVNDIEVGRDVTLIQEVSDLLTVMARWIIQLDMPDERSCSTSLFRLHCSSNLARSVSKVTQKHVLATPELLCDLLVILVRVYISLNQALPPDAPLLRSIVTMLLGSTELLSNEKDRVVVLLSLSANDLSFGEEILSILAEQDTLMSLCDYACSDLAVEMSRWAYFESLLSLFLSLQRMCDSERIGKDIFSALPKHLASRLCESFLLQCSWLPSDGPTSVYLLILRLLASWSHSTSCMHIFMSICSGCRCMLTPLKALLHKLEPNVREIIMLCLNIADSLGSTDPSFREVVEFTLTRFEQFDCEMCQLMIPWWSHPVGIEFLRSGGVASLVACTNPALCFPLCSDVEVRHVTKAIFAFLHDRPRWPPHPYHLFESNPVACLWDLDEAALRRDRMRNKCNT